MHRQRLCTTTHLLLAALFATAAFGAHAQAYPDKLVKIIVPYAAGGAVDIVARSV